MDGLNYADAWSFLDRLQFFKIKLGLDSMNHFLDSLGDPHKDFPVIHIGGTNGKGSVGATLLAILEQAGYRTGFYTSPHLSSVRERFRIGSRYISESEFAVQAEKIIRILNGRQITYFEFTTSLAMLWFAEQQVDLAVLEVGLGGRLDATNVVEPLVSVITNISMDHEQYLGNTISEVAREKAGIIKPAIPLVTGETSAEPLGVLSATADKNGSPIYILGRNYMGHANPANKSSWTYDGIVNGADAPPYRLADLPLAMRGDYQVDNVAVALATLQVISDRFPVSEDDIRKGLQKVVWPGRLEELWVPGFADNKTPKSGEKPVLYHFLLDGAHNPGGASALRKSLLNDFNYDRLVLIWASMADKDMNGTLLAIAPLAGKIIFTQPEAERSAPPETLYRLLPVDQQEKAACIRDVREAIQAAMDTYQPGDMICIAGSLYLVGKARLALCGELVDAP